MTLRRCKCKCKWDRVWCGLDYRACFVKSLKRKYECKCKSRNQSKNRCKFKEKRENRLKIAHNVVIIKKQMFRINFIMVTIYLIVVASYAKCHAYSLLEQQNYLKFLSFPFFCFLCISSLFPFKCFFHVFLVRFSVSRLFQKKKSFDVKIKFLLLLNCVIIIRTSTSLTHKVLNA